VQDRTPEEQTAAEINGLPELVINESDPTATARELAALFRQREDSLFNGYTPVRVAAEADNLPRAIPMTTESVRIYAHTICRPVKERKVKGKIAFVPVPLSKDIALLFLSLEGEWGLPHLRGITTAPILRDDGSIRIATGFDRETGLWCHQLPDIKIPEWPTTWDARAALEDLRRFFKTFPFADSVRMLDPKLGVQVTDLAHPIGLDESTFLVALLTAVCRPGLELAPGFLMRAPSYSGAGTGKGLLMKATSIIASGARPSAFTSGHDIEELDKRLTSALIEARPAVFLDNFNAKELKSDILASALTEYPAMVRPMGQTKMVPLHTVTFITISGNAVEIAEDMARRLLVSNLDAHVENPELRKFAPGFLDDVFVAREKLLTAALTIWRWGRQQPDLKRGKPFGSFELWALWCRDPLLALGCRDPIDRLAEIKAADPRRRLLIALFDAWWEKHGNAILKANELSIEVTELMSSKRGKDGGSPSRQVVARFLAKHANTRCGGYFLEQNKNEDLTRPIASYQLHQDAGTGQPA
jgi:hypothetical protein